MSEILLEVCITSADDSVVAQEHGADRLELNAALELGGLTPSLGTLLEVKAAVQLPIMVMLRPRPGGFCYSSGEFRVMRRDLDLLLENGTDGVVLGILKADGSIDRERCGLLVKQAAGTTCVFHRAFDVTPDPFAALEQLIELGFHRVMSSGQDESACKGAALLRKMMEQAAGRIEVLPTAGINRFNVRELIARTRCNQVHASLRRRQPDLSTQGRPQIFFGSAVSPSEDGFSTTHAESVAELRSLLAKGDEEK